MKPQRRRAWVVGGVIAGFLLIAGLLVLAGVATRIWRDRSAGDATASVTDEQPLLVLTGHTGAVNGLAFSPDGQMIGSGGLDNTVALWRVHDGTLLRRLGGVRMWNPPGAFSPDGRLVAAGTLDGTIGLWSVPAIGASRNGEHRPLVVGGAT